MLTNEQIRDYRLRCDLSLQDVASFCGYTRQYVGQVETGVKQLNKEIHDNIINGINKCQNALARGEYQRAIEKKNKMQDSDKSDES